MSPTDDDRTIIVGPARAEPPKAQSMPGSDNPLKAGTRIAEFEILELIGEGGFGIVYLAHDHSPLDRTIALKEYMPSELAQRQGALGVSVKSQRHADTFAAGLRSFVNEARLLAQFDHPSLVKVYRFWEANGTAYMVMPFYEGMTLRAALRGLSGPPNESWLESLLAQLLDALELIHGRQCLHRDIAPDNILLLQDGRPLLLDFGAARRVIGDMTQVLTVILKPGYAPLEQYAEAPNMKQGPWTDFYALASVVYFAIMGEAPAPAVARVMSDPVVPLKTAAAGRYSEAFLGAIDRALSVKPEERPQTAAEFRRDLGLDEWKESTTRYIAERSSSGSGSSHQNESSGTTVLLSGRWRVTLAVLALLAVAAGLTYWLQQSGSDARRPAKDRADATAPAPRDEISPEQLASAVEDRLRSFECARVNWNDEGGGALTLSGYVSAEADLQRLQTEFGSIKGVRRVDSAGVHVFARPYCEVASMLAPYANTAAPRIGLKGGGTSVVEGNRLVVEIVTAEFPGYIYADLYGAEGKVAHLLPNSEDRNNRTEAGRRLVVGERGLGWEIEPPLGPHLLVVIASRTQFLPRKRDDVEDSGRYMRAVEAALTRIAPGTDVYAHYVLVDFLPKK